ncbi:MAG: SpoIID/LytB domain-containing protein, partial [Acidobacteria bacterium]|nr:SpoIID/LytB domain-containing protein [Acidobacteriota bacterium]
AAPRRKGETPPAAPPPTPNAPSTPAAQPDVRIGLTTEPAETKLSAAGGLVILHPQKLVPLWKARFDEPVVVVVDLPKGIAPRTIFRVQVGSFATQAEADAVKDRLERLVPDPVIVSFNPERSAYRVRVGEFTKREEAAPLTDKLLEEGMTEIWVADEASPASGKARLRLVDSRYYSQVLDVKSFVAVSSVAGGTVEVNGLAYRGKLEVKMLGDSLKVINQLPLEDYLRGVVPNEMGPGIYPEIEALKAQSVAARTYIAANRGQFSESGFDICDSMSCQVYKGFTTEHALTNQAVEETAGIIAAFNGLPIKALYTSTCGGRTEDGVNIFPDQKGPYLKGVDCYPEKAEPTVLAGREDLPWIENAASPPLGPELALLVVSGVAGEEALQRKFLQEEAVPAEALGWWVRAFPVIGSGSVPGGYRFERGDILEWSRFMVKSFGWEERARISLDERDIPFVLNVADYASIPQGDARTVAFLLSEGILGVFPDGALRLHARPTRATVLSWIARIAQSLDTWEFERATFRGMQGGSLSVSQKGNLTTHPVTPGLCLYRSVRGRSYPVPRLTLDVGDEVNFHLNASGVVDVLILTSSVLGAADDRSSPYYRWDQSYTRDELEDVVKKRVDVGRLQDVVITKRGVSGRVIQMKLVGSRGTFLINGFRVRTALGLKENLFTLERQMDPSGGVAAFHFAGKGWGHGIGLCQVGAYGMAVRGEDYATILKHYYPGIELLRIY